MIRLQGVSKRYVQSPPVLDRVELELKQGDFLYVVGDSGAGKSSLLRILATEEGPTLGEVSLFGFDLQKSSQSRLSSVRRQIGYVPQNVRIFPDLTVFENVAVSLDLMGRRIPAAERESRVQYFLERLGLHRKRDHLGVTLSGGEAQRVAVARALVRNPQLLIADEPTGAQDREFTWALMEQIVLANKNGATVVLATHDREIVRKVRKRCALLEAGKLEIEEDSCTF